MEDEGGVSVWESETYLHVSLVPRPGSLGMRLGMRLEHACANVEVITPSINLTQWFRTLQWMYTCVGIRCRLLSLTFTMVVSSVPGCRCMERLRLILCLK